MRQSVFAVGLLATLLLAPAVAGAAPITFTGSQGSLAASVTFNALIGGNLQVTLTNTSSADVDAPAQVLTAVFFDIAGNLSMTQESAILAGGSTVVYDADGQPTGGVVGGEWAYKSGLAGTPDNETHGISSSGLGLFGPSNLFPGPDLEDPDSPDGVQYGLLSAGDNTGTGNTGITGSGGLIKNSVIFTLSGLPDLFDPSTAITNVSFQYGTALGEPNFPGDPPGTPREVPQLPEPATLTLLGAGLAVAAARLRKRKQNLEP
jgi:PEP-CTERM motif